MLLFKSLLIHYIRNWHGDERYSENAQIYLSFLTEAVFILLNPLWLGFLLTFLPEVFPCSSTTNLSCRQRDRN